MTWLVPLEQARVSAGHWHIEGFCAFKMGNTWSVRRSGCPALKTEDVNEPPVYRSSLDMVRDYIRTELH